MKYIDQAYAKRGAQRQQLADDVGAYYDQVYERDILKVITSTCDAALIPYMRNYPNLVRSIDGQPRLMKIPEHQKGKPDVTVLCLRAVCIWVETKATSGKLRTEQIRWKEWILARGHEYHAPRTVDEAHAVSKRILELGR